VRTDETDTCPPEAYRGTMTREDRDSHQSLWGTVVYSLLWMTIAITEGQSPPKELYPFCHLTAVVGSVATELRVLPLWKRT
jgi:hypothetical protein